MILILICLNLLERTAAITRRAQDRSERESRETRAESRDRKKRAESESREMRAER